MTVKKREFRKEDFLMDRLTKGKLRMVSGMGGAGGSSLMVTANLDSSKTALFPVNTYVFGRTEISFSGGVQTPRKKKAKP